MALVLGTPPPQQQNQTMNPDANMMQLGMPAQQKPILQQQKKTDDTKLKEIAQDIAGMTRRFRVLEERYMNMRKRAQLMDQSMLSNHKKVFNEIKSAESDIADMRRKIADMMDKFLLMAKELENCVRKTDLEVTRRYVSMWNPLNFVTQQEAEKIVKSVIEAEKSGNPVERYPVYRPETEEEKIVDDDAQQTLQERQETAEKQKETASAKKKATASRRDEEEQEEESEEETEEEYSEKESGGKDNAGDNDEKKVNLDDITNIMHRHSPF